MKNIQWTRAGGTDVNEIMALTDRNYRHEIDEIYQPQPLAFARNILFSIVRQFYNPNEDYVSVARIDGQLVGYLWLLRGNRAPWSDDEHLEWRMAHVDLALPAKTRIRLINEMIDQSILFAYHNKIPIICSSTVRKDQETFLRLHERKGFTIRGSIAYLKVNLE